MIRRIYHDDFLELYLENQFGDLLLFDNWLSEGISPAVFNTVNDLLVNGTATEIDSKRISINYEDISQIDSFEYETLGLPSPYPYDIFVDIDGSGLTDINLKLRYYFQDFAHGNGSGENLFFESNRKGAYLKNKLEFLLDSKQFALIKEIEKFNQHHFDSSSAVLKELSTIQELAARAKATMSRILVDTSIVAPERVKIDIIPIGDDRYKLSPIIDNVNNEDFQKSFDVYPTVRSAYRLKAENKKVRVVIDDKDEEGEQNSSLKGQLEKIKRKNKLTSEEINQIYNNPTSFWNTDKIDLDFFSKRVLELGIYQPRFYPFISPYKSEWIPGITIEDRNEGTRYVPIKDQEELAELKGLVEESRSKGETSFIYKGENIDLIDIDPIIDTAERQLKSPKVPITTFEQEREKPEQEKKVLIIKENTEENEYSETIGSYEDVRYNFQSVGNLAKGIQLKEHQRKGVAWLQTLSSEPYSLPGVLLADDMGLGKTIQVLYFVEWYSQSNTKPILVVAPVSLLENWQAEYLKFFPNPSLKTRSLWGGEVKQFIISNDKHQTIKNLSDKSIYFTTYETLRRHQIPLGLIDWGVVVLDEAQKVKTPGTLVTNAAKALKANFKIAMTGTPVENSLMDLWCIIDFCSPGLLENAKDFSKVYQKPLSDENTNIQTLTKKLREQIGATLFRRMKSDVAKDLPPIEYFKLEEAMPSAQFDTYVSELELIEEIKSQDESANPVLQAIHNLRRISDHPYLKHHRIESIDTERLINSSAKLKRVMSILSEIKEKNEKVIIFSEIKAMQRVLRKTISERFSITPSIINGETPANTAKKDQSKLTRQQEINKFQKVNGFNVIIMSPVAAGFGLNITEANHVIHYTRHWNPAKEQQATDRAYRIGQNKPVNVYYPLAVSPNNEFKTFDMVLDELLQRKSHLASKTLFPTEQIEIITDDLISSLNNSLPYSKTVSIASMEDLDQLNPLSFEAAIALLFEKAWKGSTILAPKQNNKDAYIVFLGASENYVITAKQSSSALGTQLCQEIKYAIPEFNSMYGKSFTSVVVTNNFFNFEANELANQNNIKLIDRSHLTSMITKYHIDTAILDKKLRELT